ncbi:ubiquitin-conjugating enzyme E2 W isoform X1 [Culicoides brevitarsis]|uniref:ubiquitin-conjugating enzyme E2 W isoform X1 n=1 Tax=Culicoides brevitarsis TaxID=469753 RepID=UPI00307C9E36
MLNKFRNSCKSSSNKSKEMPKTSKKEIIDQSATLMAIQNNGGSKKISGATQDQRILNLDYGRWEKRLQKELMSLIKEPPPGVTVDADSVSQNLSQWVVNIDGVEGTLYEGEHFQLSFKFNNRYPFDSPEVTFIGQNIPIHPHVYSNGHICLSILTDDWSPALSVQSVCLSISSMLSSCREKKRPPDNTIYVKTCKKNPKETKWWYHDDSV